MPSGTSLLLLYKATADYPKYVALLCDSDLVRLLHRPPSEESKLALFHAEFFVRLWLYGEKCPAEIRTAITHRLPVADAFRSAFLGKAVPLRTPADDSQPNYSESLAVRELDAQDRGVWNALVARLIQFLECDGLFPLVTEGPDEAMFVPFRFTRAPERRNRVFDEKKELEEWTALVEALGEESEFNIGVELAGEFPPGKLQGGGRKEIGGSLALALVLARERRRAVHIGWYSPLDVVATGAIRTGKLQVVEGVPAKRAAAQRLQAKLTIWPGGLPEGESNETLLPLPTGLSVNSCMEAIATRIDESGLNAMSFHRACLCLRQVLNRRIKELTDLNEVDEIELQLRRCLPVFTASPGVEATELERQCRATLRAARVQRFWLRGRLPLAIAAAGLIILVALWQWQEQRKAEIARLARIDRFVEQGRQELVLGSPLRALPYLSEAYREGGSGTTLRFLLARAVNALDSRVTSIGGPDDAVYYATFSPDGTRLLTVSADQNAKVWDANKGEMLLTLHGGCDRRFLPSFSPDGSLILTARGNRATLWRAADGQLLRALIGHRLDVKAATFSLDGAHAVTSSVDDTAKVWDVVTGKPLVSLTGHTATVSSALFSPDGSRVLTVSVDDTAKIWDASTGSNLLTLSLSPGGLNPGEAILKSARFSPDGLRVLTTVGTRAQVWDARTGRRLASLDAPQRVISAAFNRDGSQVLAFTPDANNNVIVWDLEARKVLTTLQGHKSWINAIEMRPDGSRFVTASWDTTARIWDAGTGQALSTLEGHKGFLVISAAYSPDGTRLVTVDGEGYGRVWDATDRKLLLSFRADSNYINAVAFNNEGTRLLSCSAGGTVKVWNALNAEPVGILTNFNFPVQSAAFDRRGTRIVTTSGFGASPLLHDPSARVWDVRSGRSLLSLTGHSNALKNAIFSQDGARILTVSEDGTVRIWNAATARPVATFSAPRDSRIVSAVLSGDGTHAFVATVDAKSVMRIWDSARNSAVSSVFPPNSFFWCGTFSSDGLRILTGSADLKAMIWDRATGKALTSLESPVPFGALTGWSPDGSRIITASGAVAKLWDSSTGRLLADLEGQTAPLACVAFSVDGSRLATAAADGTVKVWDVRLETRSDVEIARLEEAGSLWRLEKGSLVPAANRQH